LRDPRQQPHVDVGMAELRRDDDLVASPLESDAEEGLAQAVSAIDVRGIDERDAQIDGGIDHRGRALLSLRRRAGSSKVVAAHSDGGHTKRRSAERAVRDFRHGLILPLASRDRRFPMSEKCQSNAGFGGYSLRMTTAPPVEVPE